MLLIDKHFSESHYAYSGGQKKLRQDFFNMMERKVVAYDPQGFLYEWKKPQ